MTTNDPSIGPGKALENTTVEHKCTPIQKYTYKLLKKYWLSSIRLLPLIY